jgi:hypothetical protein
MGLTTLDATFGVSGESGAVRLLGYALSPAQANPGQVVELTMAWQAIGEIVSPPSFTVWLATNDGQRLTAADRYLVPGYTPGEIRFERLVLPLYPDTPAGEYDLNVQVYSTGETGFETWSLFPGEGLTTDTENTLNMATLPVQSAATPPVTLHPQNVPFKDGPTLVGVDYDRSVPGSLRLYLNWQGPAQGGEQINVQGSSARLPALAEGAHHTTVLDLPPETSGRLPLKLINADGEAVSLAGPWGWSLHKVSLPAPSDGARFVPLADEMALIGVSPGAGESYGAGDDLDLQITFLGLKPLVSDNAISVRLLDEVGNWRYVHDLQPALGAIPTLKWIRGSRVTDPHPLQVPLDMDGAVIRALLVVYDNFRGNVLPPMDGRMDGVPLGEWGFDDR